jgi:hypothetical protein
VIATRDYSVARMTLTYELPDEREQADWALRAPELAGTLYRIQTLLREHRSYHKHSDDEPDCDADGLVGEIDAEIAETLRDV